ncbi:1,2-phenylacetyl-CoA epoxidase subunit PaaC [Sporosarcina highlanderae]|uniref:Phenylacetate-CoA oxygenase subunit PaaC n=1 Tax=Sporosarcina highlanderae TaxID=3035916 RepID=A0ABT8JTC9_9BACL|nr:1,2-phenylacetyl-CoA epoxidase subunit PaaC [Sporosarcina highlanderae]MDN4608247.1 phenylacetate-CoA oxygenase subunit PaaC [Sporosarcina highlanderae]
MSEIENGVTEASENKEAITSLLFQLADDDFLYAYRGSEWLGLAPHIEEDVASSSISQDSMGHAAMYYKLLEELGVGNADDLAHLRPAHERRNSILTERVNGEGFYMETPNYDWAYQVVRSYFYTQAKKVKVDSLCQSSYKPVAEVAVKVKMELYYHRLHWETWFKQLLSSTDVAKKKMNEAITRVMDDFGDMFSFGIQKQAIEKYKLIDSEEKLKENWLASIEPVFAALQMTVPTIPETLANNGRNGEHTVDLDEALRTLSEVYKVDPVASW